MTARAVGGRREQRKARLKQTVKDAAWRLVREQGYAAVTVEQIAAASGIAVATFYRHFAGKDDVITRGWLTEDLIDDISGAITGKETLAATVRRLYAHYARAVRTYEVDLLTRLRIIECEPSLRACMMKGREHDTELLTNLFARLYGDDRAPHELRVAAGLVVAARSETLWCWVRSDGTVPLGQLLDRGARIIAPSLEACEAAAAACHR